MLRRLLTASFIACLVAGMLPAGVLAAAPVATPQSVVTDEDTPLAITLTGTDVEGSPLTFTVVAGPAHGLLTGSAPDLTYTPTANYHGPDSFTFKVNDGTTDSEVDATVSINITPVNDVPVCSGATLSTDKNVPVNGSVGCTDVDLDTLVLRIGDNPIKGTVAPFDTATGAFTYTPDLGVIGSDAFTVIANDGAIDSAPATVDIGIANHVPVCSDAAPAAAGEDTGQSGTLVCVDGDLDDLAFSVVVQPAHGTLAINAGTGAWTYAPALNWSGADAFTAQASDGAATSNVVTVSLTVTPVNDAPAATPQTVSTDEDASTAITLTGGDIEGSPLTFTVVAGPAHGQLTGSAPSLTYTPAANYNGPDTLTFNVDDGVLDSAFATVSITVTAVNDAPVCTGFAPAAGAEDTQQAGTIDSCADVDADPITYARVSDPTHGTATVGSNGVWTYTPAANHNGSDSFTFRANDGTANSNTATVSITVTAVNDPPVANSQAVTMAEDSSKAISPTGTDVEASPLTYTVLAQPAHGTLSGTAPNLTYTPAANYNGPDSFTFRASDGTASSSTAIVSITVSDVNDAPSGRIDASGYLGFPYVLATTTTALPVLANDIAGPGDTGANATMVITGASAGSLGTPIVQPGGSGILYDPRGCSTGDDDFNYSVADGGGLADPNTTVVATIVRPGAPGFSSAPVTDIPSVGLRTGASIGRTVPVRVRWCGVVKSSSRIKGFRVEQSASAGASWPTLVTRSTTATAVSRSIGTSATYAWRVRTTDTASRTGAYRASATAKASIRQETPAASVVYAGTWRTSSTSKASGGRMRSATSTSSSVTISVDAGTRQVGIVAPKGSNYGRFKVWVDGVYAGSFSERASSASYRGILFVKSVNPGTAHTIVLKPAGNGRVYLDAIVTLK